MYAPMVKYKFVLRVRCCFDLDNVLYDKKDYIFAAFRCIARFLFELCRFSKYEVYFKSVCDFAESGIRNPRLFNGGVSNFGLDQSWFRKF
jgi:hypothetical protein